MFNTISVFFFCSQESRGVISRSSSAREVTLFPLSEHSVERLVYCTYVTVEIPFMYSLLIFLQLEFISLNI